MRNVFVVGLCLFVAAISLQAQDKAARTTGFMQPIVTSDLITLQPLAEFENFTLTVSGPDGIVYQQRVNGMQTPFIETYDLDGAYLADGSYAYEIRATPILTPEMKQVLADARETGDYSEVKALRASGQLPERVEAQSGYFRIHNGFIVVPDKEEVSRIAAKTNDVGREDGERPGRPTGGVTDPVGDVGDDDTDLQNRDQIILDDLIVDGSICAGMDCVNGEAFGFDTIRLKENNLRIKFQDTSNSGSFPTRDWQITANDSTNGGAEKFSIDDIDGGRTPFTIEASAPSHSLYVDDGGRIGFGTSTPVVELHVVDGDSPTLRLEQDGSSGFTAQTWDLASNETNFFIRDATNGSRLPFRIRPSAPTNSIYVDTDGDVGLGTASPDSQLHVVGQGLLISETDTGAPADLRLLHVVGEDARAIIQRDSTIVNNNLEILHLQNNGRAFVNLIDDSQNKNWFFGTQSQSFFINDGGDGDIEFRLYPNGNLDIFGVVSDASDVNQKENFEGIVPKEVLSRVVDLPISSWNYIDTDDSIRHLGPMAQDFYAAFGLNGIDTRIAALDTSGVALGAIQGLNEVVQEKDAEIQALKSQLAAQEARLKALEDALLK
jgi:uncharacterized coiled-coil protein SlyX